MLKVLGGEEAKVELLQGVEAKWVGGPGSVEGEELAEGDGQDASYAFQYRSYSSRLLLQGKLTPVGNSIQWGSSSTYSRVAPAAGRGSSGNNSSKTSNNLTTLSPHHGVPTLKHRPYRPTTVIGLVLS